ncbi:sel1 repeat family protein [bacterium]|nr:sel1 repeat family protein [bacterium]
MAPLHSFATGAEFLRNSTGTVWDFAEGRDLDSITTSVHAGGLGTHVLGLVQHFAGTILTPEQIGIGKGLPAEIADVFGLAGEMLRVRAFDLIEHLSRHKFDARKSCSGWDGVAIAAETISKAMYSVAYAAEAVGLPADQRSNSATWAYVRAREAAEISVLVGGATAYMAAANDIEVLAVRFPSAWGDVGGAVARHELPPLWPEGPPENFPPPGERRDALGTYLDFREMQRGEATPFTDQFEERLFESTALFEVRMAFFLSLILSKEFKTAVWRPTYHVIPVPEFDVKVLFPEGNAHVFVTSGAVAFFEFVAHSIAFEHLVGGAAENSEVMKASVFGAGMLQPALVPGPTKTRILREAFDRKTFPSIEDFIEHATRESGGRTDGSFFCANTLYNCVRNSIAADFLLEPVDLLPMDAHARTVPGVRSNIVYLYLVAFTVLHECAHLQNKPTDELYAARAKLPKLTWSEFAADALAFALVDPLHHSGLLAGARTFFSFVQKTGAGYPDPLVRVSVLRSLSARFAQHGPPSSPEALREVLLETIGALEPGRDLGFVGSYRDQFGTGQTMFGVEASPGEKVAVCLAAHKWLQRVLVRLESESEYVTDVPPARTPAPDRGVQLNESTPPRFDPDTPAWEPARGVQLNESTRPRFGRAFQCLEDKSGASDAEAAQLLLPLAESGFAPAQDLLGDILWSHKGRGKVPYDDAAAEKWYRRAAASGLSYSQVSLGGLLLRKGTEEARNEALVLLKAAEKQGNPGAKRILEAVVQQDRLEVGSLPRRGQSGPSLPAQHGASGGCAFSVILLVVLATSAFLVLVGPL